MNSFSDRILETLQVQSISFPGLDNQAILEQVLPTAEEYVTMKIVTSDLSLDDQSLFRDALQSAPDIFDPGEFLEEALPNFEALQEKYFKIWLSDFTKNLTK